MRRAAASSHEGDATMPALLTRIPPYAIALLFVGLTHWYAYSRGENHTKAVYELKLQELRTASAAAAAKLERQARDAERGAAAAMANQSEKHAQEVLNAQSEIDNLRADLRARRVRLSVPVDSCTAGSETGADSAAAGQPRAEARAELVPETAAELVSIAADGDAAVRQLNALIDVYNALRDQYNAMTAGGS
jgi:hypothetical protein